MLWNPWDFCTSRPSPLHIKFIGSLCVHDNLKDCLRVFISKARTRVLSPFKVQLSHAYVATTTGHHTKVRTTTLDNVYGAVIARVDLVRLMNLTTLTCDPSAACTPLSLTFTRLLLTWRPAEVWIEQCNNWWSAVSIIHLLVPVWMHVGPSSHVDVI